MSPERAAWAESLQKAIRNRIGAPDAPPALLVHVSDDGTRVYAALTLDSALHGSDPQPLAGINPEQLAAAMVDGFARSLPKAIARRALSADLYDGDAS